MNLLVILLAGILTGVASGLFGIGGGLLLTPVIRVILEKPAYIALGTTIPVLVPAAVIGLIVRRKKRFVVREAFLFAAFGSLIGSATGAYITACIDSRFLMILTALIMIAAGTDMLIRRVKRINDDLRNRLNKKYSLYVLYSLIGLSAGLLAGLLGLGGGLVLVPGFLIFAGLTAHEATATSLAVILVSALPSLIIHAKLGHIDWMLAGYFSVIVPLGSYLGSVLNIRMRERVLKASFGLFLICFGVVFALREVM